MGQTGLGVMIKQLFGTEEGVEIFNKSIGKTITALSSNEDALYITFEDGKRISLFDDGQSCCEHRYMRTDDDLDYYVGSKLLGGEIKDAPSVEAEYDEHEVQFLEIITDKGSFTMSNHNEHNGYYGGFWIKVSEES